MQHGTPTPTLYTPGTPEETGPLRQKTDPAPRVTTNVIRYSGVGNGIDAYSGNIPRGEDAIAAFEEAIRSKKFLGVKIARCALIGGGTLDRAPLNHKVNAQNPNLASPTVHGGTVIAEWSLATGIRAQADWKEHVGGLPRPKIVPGLPEGMTGLL